MFRIPLDPIPNQRCSVRLDGALFTLEIKEGRSLMTFSAERDGIALIRGIRCLPYQPLIPHRYLESAGGNFYFVNEDGAYPRHERFGAEDALYYLTPEEMEAIRHG